MQIQKYGAALLLLALLGSAQAGTGAAGHSHHEMQNDPHGMHGHHNHHGSTAAGEAGKAADVTRTFQVEATDRMRFIGEPLQVKAGETLKFVVTNSGKVRHEFAIGLKPEHVEHQKMMRKMPNMVHDEANAVTLEPGETKELIWKFAKAGNIEVACNLPGHYEAGMRRPVMVE